MGWILHSGMEYCSGIGSDYNGWLNWLEYCMGWILHSGMELVGILHGLDITQWDGILQWNRI